MEENMENVMEYVFIWVSTGLSYFGVASLARLYMGRCQNCGSCLGHRRCSDCIVFKTQEGIIILNSVNHVCKRDLPCREIGHRSEGQF